MKLWSILTARKVPPPNRRPYHIKPFKYSGYDVDWPLGRRGNKPMKVVKYPSLDGLSLVANLYIPDNTRHCVILCHGIMSERTEEGLYSSISKKLEAASVASLAFDFRAHGATGGPQEQMTLTGLINDIVASIKFIQSRASVQRFSLIAASFSGGVATYVAAKFREVSSVVLLNPRLNYLPWIAEPKFWLDGRFDADAAKKLHKFGYLKRNGFHMGVPLINELIGFDPSRALKDVGCDILFVHGTEDTVVPIITSRQRYNENRRGQLVEIEGAEHGFVSPATDSVNDSLSVAYREEVINQSVNFVLNRLQ